MVCTAAFNHSNRVRSNVNLLERFICQALGRDKFESDSSVGHGSIPNPMSLPKHKAVIHQLRWTDAEASIIDVLVSDFPGLASSSGRTETARMTTHTLAMAWCWLLVLVCCCLASGAGQ